MWKDGMGRAHTDTSRDEWAGSWSTLLRVFERMRQPESGWTGAELRSSEPDLEQR